MGPGRGGGYALMGFACGAAVVAVASLLLAACKIYGQVHHRGED